GGVGGGAAGESGGAGHQHIGAGGDDLRCGAGVDATIDLELDRPATVVDHPAQPGDLVELAVDEALPAETGIDAHHQNQVDVAHQVLDRLDGGRRVQYDAGLL